MIENKPLAGQAVDMRGVDPAIAVSTEMGRSVIGDTEKDIRDRLGRHQPGQRCQVGEETKAKREELDPNSHGGTRSSKGGKDRQVAVERKGKRRCPTQLRLLS
jgi:hypothetical protein